MPNAVNLFLWGDSLCFRRPFQPDDLKFTFPFLTQQILKQQAGIEVNLLVRSRGGVTITECRELIERDSAYFFFRNDIAVVNVAILQLGVVDCAPIPFTYRPLKAILKIPYIGGKIAQQIVKRRALFQNIYSSPKTSKVKFTQNYSKILRLLSRHNFVVIGVGIPTPTKEIEERSPGFRRNAIVYSELIQELSDNYIDVERELASRFPESDREKVLVRDDGHHLTELGHQLYAELISKKILEAIELPPKFHLPKDIV